MTQQILEKMYETHTSLMDNIEYNITDSAKEKVKYYNLETHQYICKHGWEILLPLPKEEWGQKILDRQKYYNRNIPWPAGSTYHYCMDVLTPPNFSPSFLYFGYAIMEDLTVLRTSFFHWFEMVPYQEMPQGIVMDPLADLHNKKPQYYVGMPAEIEDIEKVLLERKGNPLELYVARKSKEEHEQRLHDMYMEAYTLQMAYEPLYMPRKLQEFAKANNLWIPEGQKSTK